MDRALGNPLGNPLGLARGTTGERGTVFTVQANGTFEIPARFNFAVLHWFGAGHTGGTYVGGAGGGYAGTKPIKLASFASRELTVSGGFSCTGLGYVLSTVYQDDRNVGVGGDYNYKGGKGGPGADGGAYFSNMFGAGGGAAGPSGDGADGAGWVRNPTTFQLEVVPAGMGASGGGGVGIGYSSSPGSAGGGGGGGIGGGGRGGGSTPYLPSRGMGSSVFYSSSMEGGSAPGSSGGAGGLGGGGGGAGYSSSGPGGQFLLVVELW